MTRAEQLIRELQGRRLMVLSQAIDDEQHTDPRLRALTAEAIEEHSRRRDGGAE
jgi:hypothetical protein